MQIDRIFDRNGDGGPGGEGLFMVSELGILASGLRLPTSDL